MGVLLLNEEEIRYRVAQVGDLPTMPLALQRLLEIVHNEVSTLVDLERLMRYDQGLSAKMLRVANSAYYGFRGKTNTLTRALMLIGFDQSKYICMNALLIELFSPGKSLGHEDRERLWKHSFATATIASEIAAKRPWISRDEAYILGLLHDMGRVVMGVYFNEQYREIQSLAQARKVPVPCIEAEFGMKHTLIGSWIAVRWAFPESFRMVMEFHHLPDRSPSFKAEVKMIALANILANSREYPEMLSDEYTRSYCRDLFITEEEWDAHCERLQEIWLQVDQFWNLLR